MKQTAVEFLEEQIKKFHNWKLNQVYDENCFDEIELHKSIKQAKEMERQQIIMAFWNSKHSLCDENTDLLYLAEQYYNAKFNGQNT